MPELILNNAVVASHQIAHVYASFAHAARQLEGLVAVDYFFAKEISQCLGFASSDLTPSDLASPDATSPGAKVTGSEQAHEQQQWFHLLVALSASLRDGHSCLPLAQVAGKRLFVDGMSQSGTSANLNNKGFLFSDLTTLNTLVAKLPLVPLTPLNENDQQSTEQHLNALEPIVFSHERLYLRRYFQFEQELKQVVFERRNISAQQIS